MKRLRLRPLVLLLATVLMAALTARLGLWQLDRAAEKTALQRTLDERAVLPPLTGPGWPEDEAAIEAARDRRAQLTGRWRPEHQVALDNRPMDARVGFYIVMPLELSDGRSVLVQRGWIPRDAQERTRLAPFGTPAGEVAVGGRIAPRLPRLYALADEETGPIRQNLEVAAFSRETGLQLLPWVLIQSGESDDGLRRNWPAPATGVDKHHGYAFQWFSLSALTIGLYVWYQFLRPRRRAAQP